ncbi:hypothetical protein ABZ642_26835 [Streptomyces sp. NPDC007157]|uniref:hypothetical protein n=1 Tax=Streptomyces sp. NPDC007157 TaxID=3154681 RepID=UPI00340E0305
MSAVRRRASNGRARIGVPYAQLQDASVPRHQEWAVRAGLAGGAGGGPGPG